METSQTWTDALLKIAQPEYSITPYDPCWLRVLKTRRDELTNESAAFYKTHVVRLIHSFLLLAFWNYLIV